VGGVRVIWLADNGCIPPVPGYNLEKRSDGSRAWPSPIYFADRERFFRDHRALAVAWMVLRAWRWQQITGPV